jgi:hypothetical protein
VHSGGAFSLTAVKTVALSGAYGVSASSATGTAITATSVVFAASNSDVLLQTQAGAVSLVGQTFGLTAQGDTSRAGAVARNLGGVTFVAPNRVSFTSPTSIAVTSAAESRLSGGSSFVATSSTTVTLAATEKFVIGSSGRNTVDASSSIGTLLQADTTLQFGGSSVQLTSGAGQVIISAAELYVVLH